MCAPFVVPILSAPILSSHPSIPGLEFTTKAFVGRIDIAVSLSQTRHPPPDGMEADWSKARTLPKDGLIELAKKLVTPQAVGVVTAVGIAAVATWYTLGHCRKVRNL